MTTTGYCERKTIVHYNLSFILIAPASNCEIIAITFNVKMKCSTVQVQNSLTDSVVSYAAVSVGYTRPSKALAAEP